MKLAILETLTNIPEGIELNYETTENKVTLIIGYTPIEKFKPLCTYLNMIADKFASKGYAITYDNFSSKHICGQLKHYRYIALRPKKEGKC